MTNHPAPAPEQGAPQRLGLRVAVGGATLLLLVLYSAAVSVKERHTALVTRFGKLVRTIDEPGLHWKLPWPIEAETLVDRRLSVLETRHTEALTRDRRNVVLQTYVAWRVSDAELFYRAVGGPERAREILSDQMSAAKAAVLAENDLSALVSTDPDELRASEIEGEILARVVETARADLGIQVESVGFKRLSFPEANIASVFDQMRAERKREADTARAEGEAEADRIRSETDRDVKQLVSEAEREAQVIRGEAEAEIARTLVEVKDLDPDFFGFMVKMNALEELVTSNTALFLQTDQAPFDLFNGGLEGARLVGDAPADGSGDGQER